MAKKGEHLSEETREKIATAKKGVKRKPFSAEWRANLSAAQKNKIGPNKGKTFSAEWKAKISVTMKKSITPARRAEMSAAMAGHNNHQWRGGLSVDPYSWAFTDELKEEVRRRDNYICQLCGVPQSECREDLHCHHIDYDKKNSDPVNLIALCRSCHGRTHHNRPHWTSYFRTLILKKELSHI